MVLAALAGPGCGSVCSGPGCEDFYAVGRLSALTLPGRPAPGVTAVVDVWADADARYDGAPAQGPDWSVAVVPGGGGSEATVIVGQPAASQVLRLPPIAGVEDVGGVDPVWSDAREGSFGADVVAVTTDAAAGAYDLWIGAPDLQGGAGRVFLFRDAHLDDPESAAPDLQIQGLGAVDGLGTRLFPCADLTGDGAPDLVIAAPRFSTPPRWGSDPIPEVGELAGAVLVVRSEAVEGLGGEVESWEVGPLWWGGEAGEGAGTAVSCDRDLDADDRFDVAIGAPWSDGGRGRVYLVAAAPVLPAAGPLRRGRAETGVEVASRVIPGPDEGGWFGYALAAVDRPIGPPQLAVGAPGADQGDGRVYLYDAPALSGTTPEPTATFLAGVGRTGDHVGRALAVGHVDGDDIQDLLVGAQDYHVDAPNGFDNGAIFVWTGATRGDWVLEVDVTVAPYQIAGNQPFQRTGRRIGVADGDGDGVAEVWVPTRSAGRRPVER